MKLQKLYDKGYDWILTHGPGIIVGLFILFIGLWLIKILRLRLSDRMRRTKVHSSLQPFFLSLTITTLYVLLLLMVLTLIGFPISSFATIIGGFTVALGLALSGTFQNFAGGVLILLLKPFELDDNIIAQGQDGRVTSIQIFYTVLVTVDNKTIIIPNGKLFNEVIVNVTREGKRRLDFEVKLAYAADVAKAKLLIINAVNNTANVLADPAIRVGIVSLDVDSIKFTVNVWVAPADFLNVKIALMEKILADLTAAGIPFPKAG
jgi:small conductance mechanosensitive channel